MHALAIEQIEKETEQLKREKKRLAELNYRLNALLPSPDSSCSSPPKAGCN
jgi:hypothetical protein